MYDEDEQVLVARVRATSRARSRCGVCRRPAPGYDGGAGRRRWRALDLGTVRVVLEADAPRVRCLAHGVIVAHLPWARHGAGHTYAFDDQTAWLAVQCSKSRAPPVDAGGVAHGRGDHHPGRRRRVGGHGPVREPAPDRDR